MQWRGWPNQRRPPEKNWFLTFGLSRSLKVIGTDTDRPAIYDFLLVFSSNFVHKTHFFSRYSTSKMLWPWKPGYGPSISLEMSPFDRAHTFCSNYGSTSCRFWDIQCRKMSWPLNPGQRSLKVIESGTIRYINYGFLLVFCSNFVRKMHCLWYIRLVTIQWPWNWGYESLKVIGTEQIDSPPIISY